MTGWFVSGYFEPGAKKQTGYSILSAVLVYALVLGYLSNERCHVWYDAGSLWRDEIEKEPVRAPNAYNNLGFNYFNKFNESVNPDERKKFYDSSYYLLRKAIEIQPTFANPYISLGELERSSNHFNEARGYYYKALSLKSFDEDANAYLGLGIIYAIGQHFDSAYYCLSMATKLKPYFPEAHSNFGNFFDMTGKPDSALVQYGFAIAQNPDMYAPHLNRGRLLHRLHRTDEAMKDFAQALELNPDMGEIYYARSFCYAQKNDKVHALQDIEKAISLGFRQIDNNYYTAMKSRN
jgi:tetratricopeptide (TPR) repeat protein